MIQETCLRIGELEERWVAERELRNARRNKIRRIDRMLNELEMLNLAEEKDIPTDLHDRVVSFVAQEHHPLVGRLGRSVVIADWMEALYDVQDALLIPFDDDPE